MLDPRDFPAPPSLTGASLLALRSRSDRFGLVALLLGITALCLFLPLLGTGAFLLLLIFTLLAGAGNAIHQTTIVANGVPIGVALGSAWEVEVNRLLAATGRRPGSVTVVITNQAQPNAFATWRPGYRAIAVSSGLVALVQSEPMALRAVLAHELGHLLFAHVPPLIFFSGSSLLPIMRGPLGSLSRLCILWWQRHTECSADRVMLALTGSPLLSLRMIVALHQGSLPEPAVVAALCTPGRHPAGRFVASAAEMFSTHPFLARRCRTLVQFACDAQYQPWWRPEVAAAWRRDLAILGYGSDPEKEGRPCP